MMKITAISVDVLTLLATVRISGVPTESICDVTIIVKLENHINNANLAGEAKNAAAACLKEALSVIEG